MNKNSIANLSVFLVLFLVVWFGILPLKSEISSVRNDIKSKKETVDLENKVLEKLNSISQLLDSKESSVERLKQAIPTTELRPELLNIMENIASQNGLILKNISIDIAPESNAVAEKSAETEGSGSEATSLKKVMIKISTSGSYIAFKSWLNAIESNLRITDISRVSFSVSEKGSESEGELEPNLNSIMDYSVEMAAYSLNK